jgi:hypothetical protein
MPQAAMQADQGLSGPRRSRKLVRQILDRTPSFHIEILLKSCPDFRECEIQHLLDSQRSAPQPHLKDYMARILHFPRVMPA